MKKSASFLVVLFSIGMVSCQKEQVTSGDPFQDSLANSAISIIDPSIFYDPSYRSIAYPNGDVPEGTGVCTDVIIRTYRKMEIDLQEMVHEDMRQNFHLYPKNWGTKAPDPNIDHRRVPNLMTFFNRHGKIKRISFDKADYAPWDIVAWDLGGGILHIGMVSSYSSKKNGFLVVHNIGSGQVLEDVLFSWKIIGHYSYST